MKHRILHFISRASVIATLITCAGAVTPARGGDDSRPEPGKLEGTWLTQVTLRDCRTGAVLRAFPALNTFTKGETLIDTSTVSSPALRSPGQGKWEKTGKQTYTATSLAFLFNPGGVFTGTQRLNHTIEVKGDVSEFRSTVQFFDTNGTETATGCATAIGRRL